MSVSREQLLHLLQQSLMQGDGLIGGRRGMRRSASMPRHRARSTRRTRGRGEGDMMTMDDMELVLPTESRYGNGLIGGKKKRPKKMTEETKRYLKAYRKKHPRRSRGRGLIGGSSQEYFDQVMDDFMFDNPSASLSEAEQYAREQVNANRDLLKMGVTPRQTKDQLVRAIRSLERRIGVPESITTHLRAMTKSRLQKLLQNLTANKDVYARPTYAEEREAEEEMRYGDRYEPARGSSAEAGLTGTRQQR